MRPREQLKKPAGGGGGVGSEETVRGHQVGHLWFEAVAKNHLQNVQNHLLSSQAFSPMWLLWEHRNISVSLTSRSCPPCNSNEWKAHIPHSPVSPAALSLTFTASVKRSFQSGVQKVLLPRYAPASLLLKASLTMESEYPLPASFSCLAMGLFSLLY